MTKPITISICTYNGEKYLDDVIESIIKQDNYDKYVDKLQIVDNASSDNTKDIILKYQKKYPNIEYIYEEKPGLSYARRHGAVVDSEWIAYLDDDNILMKGWVIEAVKFITNNPKIGAFNGASIATIRHEISEEETIILKAIYDYLACTHCCIEDYKMKLASAIKGPFGAGIVLKTKPLKEFLSEGWTKNIGRKGSDLGSGEDGEIVNAIIERGFLYGYNDKMALLHIIPKSRLQESYILKLIHGLNKGYYVYLSRKKNYVYYRSKTFLKSIVIILVYPLKKKFLANDQISRLRMKLDFDSRKRMIEFILKDLFVIREK